LCCGWRAQNIFEHQPAIPHYEQAAILRATLGELPGLRQLRQFDSGGSADVFGLRRGAPPAIAIRVREISGRLFDSLIAGKLSRMEANRCQ